VALQIIKEGGEERETTTQSGSLKKKPLRKADEKSATNDAHLEEKKSRYEEESRKWTSFSKPLLRGAADPTYARKRGSSCSYGRGTVEQKAVSVNRGRLCEINIDLRRRVGYERM